MREEFSLFIYYFYSLIIIITIQAFQIPLCVSKPVQYSNNTNTSSRETSRLSDAMIQNMSIPQLKCCKLSKRYIDTCDLKEIRQKQYDSIIKTGEDTIMDRQKENITNVNLTKHNNISGTKLYRLLDLCFRNEILKEAFTSCCHVKCCSDVMR